MTPQAIAEVYATDVLSGFDFYKPDYLEKLFRRYGDQGMSYFQLLRTMGFETPTGRDTYGHFEENRTHEVFHSLNTVTASTAGADQSITLESQDLDSNLKFYPRVGAVVTYPNEAVGTIVAINTSTPSAPVLTIRPHDATETLPTVNAGDTLIITSSIWPEGSDQPVGAVKGTYKYENDAQIIKETMTVTGTELVNQTWFTKYGDDGKTIVGYYTVGLMDIDYRMNLNIDGALLFGKRVTNTSHVDATTGYAFKGTEGLFPFIRRLGNVNDIAAGAFAVTDFDVVDRTLDQQGVSKYSLTMPGINRHQEMENVLVTYFTDTNITFARQTVNEEIFNSNESLGAVVNFKYLTKSERIFMFKRFNNLNNPKTYGATGYQMPNYAVFMPVGSTKDAGTKKLVNNIGCRYRALGAYSRRMEVYQVGGAGAGLKVSSIDNLNTYQRAHIGAHFAAGNQFYLISPAL